MLQSKEEGLEESHAGFVPADEGRGVAPVVVRRHVIEEDRESVAAKDSKHVGVDREDRRHDRTGDDARDHQIGDGIRRHGSHGIELLGDPHGSQFRRECAADSSGDHHRRQYRSDLLDDRDVDDAAHRPLKAEGLELHEGLERQDHPDERARDSNDRYGGDSDGQELGCNQPPSHPDGATDEEPPQDRQAESCEAAVCSDESK